MICAVVFDPAIATGNLGDEVISSAVSRLLDGRVDIIDTISTHRRPSAGQRKHLAACDIAIVAGTNTLSGTRRGARYWPLSRQDRRLMAGKTLLIGVGWWQYQKPPMGMMANRIRRMLSEILPHSVRDAYTKRQLIVAGVPEANIFNTSCPSLWDLPPVRQLASPETLVVTLTDYNKSPAADHRLLLKAVERFNRVLLWPQSARDRIYAQSLAVPGVGFIDRTIDALRRELLKPDAAYAGTRLHAGAVALQCGAPTLILAVDNRATEIGRDTGLPTIPREDSRALTSWLASPTSSTIRLPVERDRWFQALERSLPVQRVG